MPTAPKLISALLFGFVAWAAAGLVIAYLPPNTQLRCLNGEGCELNGFGLGMAAIGLLCGWLMMGARAGHGYWAALGFALTTGALIVFWGLFTFAGAEMLHRALNVRYHGAIEALSDQVKLMMDYALVMWKPDVVGWLVVGSLFAGVLTEMSSRRFS